MSADELTGVWDADPQASSVTFKVRKLGVLRVTGQFPLLSASAEVGPGPSLDRLETRIGAAGFETGNSQRDTDVRSPRFLDAEQHPEITFSAGQAERSAEAWHITGELNVRGVSHTETLVLHYADVTSREDGSGTARFRATTVVDRTTYGVTAMPRIVGRELQISLDITFARRTMGGS
jgi:polyisoprenoid-binding protein YceI